MKKNIFFFPIDLLVGNSGDSDKGFGIHGLVI